MYYVGIANDGDRRKTMTHYQKTVKAFKIGAKELAFEMFLADPDANEGITFDRFCEVMEKTVANWKE